MSWPSAEQISRYLQAQTEGREDQLVGLQLPNLETWPQTAFSAKPGETTGNPRDGREGHSLRGIEPQVGLRRA